MRREPVVALRQLQQLFFFESDVSSMEDEGFAEDTADVVAAFRRQFHHGQGVVGGGLVVIDAESYGDSFAQFGVVPKGVQHREGLGFVGVAVEIGCQQFVGYSDFIFHIL